MIKNWEKFNEDVYYPSEPEKIDHESILTEFAEKFADENMGDIVNSNVYHKFDNIYLMSVSYKKEHRLNPDKVRRGDGDFEKAKENAKREWRGMADDMIDELKYIDEGRESNYEAEIDMVSHNGYTIEVKTLR